MTNNSKIRLYLKTARIEKSRYDWCTHNNHFGKKTNEDGLCHYCECCFIMYEKLIAKINMLEKTRQIIVIRKMRRTFTINAN